MNYLVINYLFVQNNSFLKWYESESPVGKDSLPDSVSLNQSDNETMESDSITFSLKAT